MAEMSFAEHNNMVKTIPSDRADEPLRVSVLPGRPWRDRPIPYTHCSKPLDDNLAIDAIAILDPSVCTGLAGAGGYARQAFGNLAHRLASVLGTHFHRTPGSIAALALAACSQISKLSWQPGAGT
jgi:hypothetical protein